MYGVFSHSFRFTYSLFVMKNHAIPEMLRYIITYAATTVSLTAVYWLRWYYHTVFKYKHRRVASVISHILDIRYEHYPQVAVKALHKKKAWGQVHQQMQDYENQTFETLDKVTAQPTSVGRAKHSRLKLLLIGVVLSVLAIMPLSYQFVPRHVDYKETTKVISLKPGLNRIGQVAFILSPDGKVLKAEKIERHLVHKPFGFKSWKSFFGNAAPFFPFAYSSSGMSTSKRTAMS